MSAYKITTPIICFLWLAFAAQVHAKDEIPLAFMNGLNNPQYERVNSVILERGFHTYIRLPESYGKTDTRYPVIYLLDGGATFPILAGYYNYLSLAEDIPDMIVIGISYGATTFEGGNFRSTDFTAASSERSYWGGAPKFQSFLKQELMPFMENKYRIDPSRRIIMGQSLGGQFVLYSALSDPDLFWGHIASNPALHRNMPYFRDHESLPSSMNSKLFISLAENDDDRFKLPANQWVDAWQDRAEKPWTMEVKTQEGHNHFSALTAAFRDGLMWIFSQD